MKSWYDQAVGAYEASALLGVHFTVPARMADRGVLTAHRGDSAHSEDPSRASLIFDGGECEENFREYEEKVASRGGKSDRRPRGWLHLRPEVLKRLQAVKAPIPFDDAITVGDASKLMGVHFSLVARMLREGKLIGRVAWSRRVSPASARLWIVSRSSVMDNIRRTKALEAAGKKRGIARKKK